MHGCLHERDCEGGLLAYTKKGPGQGGWIPLILFFLFLLFFHPFFVLAAFYVYLSRVWVVVGVIEEGVTKPGRCSLSLFLFSLNKNFSLPPFAAKLIVCALFSKQQQQSVSTFQYVRVRHPLLAVTQSHCCFLAPPLVHLI